MNAAGERDDSSASQIVTLPPMIYPVAACSAESRTIHSTTVRDPYDWLADDGCQQTLRWLEAQEALTRDVLARLPNRQRIRRLLEATPRDVPDRLPILRGSWRFTLGSSENGGVALFRQTFGGRGAATKVFDPARIESLHAMRLHRDFIYVSSSGRYLAAGLGAGGSDWVRLCLFDLERQQLIGSLWPPTLHLVVAWSDDERSFFYNATRSQFAASDRHDGVYRHELGVDPAADVLVFDHEDGEGHAALPIIAGSSRMLLVKTLDFVTQRAALYARALDEDAAFRCLLPTEAACNIVGDHDGELYVETRAGAARGRILAIDPGAPPARLREVVPEQREALQIAAHSTWSPLSTLAGGKLFATYVRDAAHCVRIFDLSCGRAAEAALPRPCSVIEIQSAGAAALVALTSFTVPFAQYIVAGEGDASITDGEASGDGTHQAARTEQFFCPSEDGTRIAAFVVRPANSRAPLPTLLYGYGGWGSSLTPAFRPEIAVWIGLGGAYVVANTRGGGEYGEQWHAAGARLNKCKAFEDFCAVGEALIARGVCPRSGLVARGVSNGGLLVAAAVNYRPDLFVAAAAEVPLVDVVQLRDLPAGDAFVAEFGDPLSDPATFDYMLSYSPLQNVRPQPSRPAMLLAPADRDERVPAAQAYKLVAALQATAGPGQIALLRPIPGEGHTNWSWSSERELLVDELAFLHGFASGSVRVATGSEEGEDLAV